MKVEVCIPERWTAVDMTWDEIMTQLDIYEHEHDVKRLVSSYYGMLAAIPAETIAEMDQGVRNIIANGLRRQAARFNPLVPAADAGYGGGAKHEKDNTK